MIPSTTAFLEQDFEIEEQPTHTYKMNLASELVRGYTDYQEAMKQAIYKNPEHRALPICDVFVELWD